MPWYSFNHRNSYGRQLLFSRQISSVNLYYRFKEAIESGLVRMMCILIPYFLCGLMDVATGMLRGIGYSVMPMIITVAGVCGLRIVWIYTIFRIPEYHTLKSLYFSYTISWLCTFLIEFVVFMILMKRMSKSQANKLPC